jgi:hypothetical protein
VKAARKKASAVLLDPKAAMRQERSQTFEQVVQSFMKRYVHAQELRSAGYYEAWFTKYCFPLSLWRHSRAY